MKNIEEFTDSSWQREVIEAHGLVRVDFWAPWCGPCQSMMPALTKIADDYQDKIKIGKLEIDTNAITREAFAVRSIPLLVIFKEGKEIARTNGAMSKSQLAAFIEPHLK